jgi:hypothetical protein
MKDDVSPVGNSYTTAQNNVNAVFIHPLQSSNTKGLGNFYQTAATDRKYLITELKDRK